LNYLVREELHFEKVSLRKYIMFKMFK
jgi:hypothetical protein